MTQNHEASSPRHKSDGSVTCGDCAGSTSASGAARGRPEPGARRPQDQLHGSSYEWWPPRRDHLILYKANPVRFAYLDRFVGDWRPVRVLDVGCGGGYTSEFLARRGATVSGTDLFPEALHEARSHAARTGLAIDYRQCTRTRLPFGDREMDVVTCFDVLEHAEDKATLLAEIHRVLRPGGVFLFDTLNRSWWSKLAVIWLGEHLSRLLPRGTHEWQHFLTPRELGALLGAGGFDVIALAGLVPDPRRLMRGDLPVRVDPAGNRSILYFGAAQARPSSSFEPSV